MMKTIVVADSQVEYVKRLALVICNEYKEVYQVETIYDEETLQQYIAQNECDILLLTPAFYSKNLTLKNVKLPVILLEDKEEFSLPERLKWSINKYTRITKLIDYIEQEYEKAEKNRTLIYGVYSPAGGVGKSTIAIAIAMAYAKVGKKVLYLNREQVDSTSMFFVNKNYKGYSVVENSTFRHLFSTSQVCQDNKTKVMYLDKPMPKLCGVDHLACLLKEIRDNEDINVVVIDFNSSPTCLNDSLLLELDELVLINNNRMNSQYKLNKWLKDGAKQLEFKVSLVINEGQEIRGTMAYPIRGRVNTLNVTEPIEVCEYIVEHELLSLQGLKNKR